jgi:hypothetical protein
MRGAALPVSNALTVGLTNVRAAIIDLMRAGIDVHTAPRITVDTDGPTRLQLTGLVGGQPVLVAGVAVATAGADGSVAVELSAGRHELTVAEA